MKEFTARLVSKPKDGRKAQVVVVLEVSGEKTSITRHVKREGGQWVGFNPDPRAIEANAATEETFAVAKIGVENLSKKLENLKVATEPDAEAIRKAEVALANASTSLVEASQRYTAVQAEYPLEVAFRF